MDKSRIDLLCVMRRLSDCRELILRTTEVSAAVGLNYDVVVPTTFLTRSDSENHNTPFSMDTPHEALPI